MFVRHKVIAALESNAGAFVGYQQGSRDQLAHMRRLLEMVAGWSRTQLEAALAGWRFPGALPTSEQDQGDQPTIPFPHRWQNHEEARAWALDILRGRPTFAVDGSQIPARHAYSIPVALIQIGWFENPHQAGVNYEKDVEVEILTPAQLAYADGAEAVVESEIAVGLRRYERETQRIATYLRQHAGDPARPLAFFDGSLVASFAARLPEPIRRAYIRATLSMLSASHTAGVPLVGYVDTSYARDLVDMVTCAAGVPTSPISDASLLSPYMRWGDRSPAYVCARADNVLADYQDDQGHDWSQSVAFVYLKTNADLAPARIEFPLWVLEAGRLDDLLDLVRAEAIVGAGYPYPLETADAVAVLTMEDREQFYRTFQAFARRHQLSLHFSRKALSKRQRRV